jgi:hypothetical protein
VIFAVVYLEYGPVFFWLQFLFRLFFDYRYLDLESLGVEIPAIKVTVLTS